MSIENEWRQLCGEQGWHVETQVGIFESFLRERGLFVAFLMHAQAVADEENGITDFVVLYRDNKVMRPADAPIAFICRAKEGDEAEDLCLEAHPGVEVLWVHEGKVVEDALDNYWQG